MEEKREDRQRLRGVRIAILAENYFENSELLEPKKAFEEEGAEVKVISPQSSEIQGVNHVDMADKIKVDVTLDEANPDDFDALFLPGGAVNADQLRVNKKAQEFVMRMEENDKPIAVICHGPWLLVSANLVNGRTMTSYHTIKDDLRNAGARWINYEAVLDENWVSSRNPEDIPAFNEAAIELFNDYCVEEDFEEDEYLES